MDSCFVGPFYTAGTDAFKFNDLYLLEGLLVVICKDGFGGSVIDFYPSVTVLVQVGLVFSCIHDVPKPVMDLCEHLMSISCLCCVCLEWVDVCRFIPL